MRALFLALAAYAISRIIQENRGNSRAESPLAAKPPSAKQVSRKATA